MPVLITTPYPTLEETAKAYGMPLEEARKVEKLVLDMLDRDARKVARKKRPAVKKQAGKRK